MNFQAVSSQVVIQVFQDIDVRVSRRELVEFSPVSPLIQK